MWERGENTDDDDDDGDANLVMAVANDIEWDNLENEDALTCIGSSLQAGRVRPGAGGGGPYHRPTLGVNRGGRLCRHARGASGGGRLRCRAPRAKGSEPLCLGAGAGSKWPRSDEEEQRSGGLPPKHIYRPTALR